MVFDNAAADRQPDSIPRIFAHAMKSLKNLKNPVGIFYVEAHPVIRNRENPR